MRVFEFCLLFWFCLFKRGREHERETDRWTDTHTGGGGKLGG